MASLAYVLLPLSGLLAYLKGPSERVRWHGLQAIVYGTLWPAAMYACTLISSLATQAAFVVGALLWLVLMSMAAAGRDISLPFVGRWLKQAAVEPPGN